MEGLIKFFLDVGKLKRTRRTGWVLREVKDSESIADHSFRLTLLAWLLPRFKNYDIDVERVVRICITHDVCEVYAGDSTPYDDLLTSDVQANRKILSKWPRRSREEKERLLKLKHEKEEKALRKILKPLPTEMQKEMMDLWQEYEVGETKEGRFCRQLDRLETLMQALEYEKEDKYVPIKSFWEQVKELIDDPILIEFMSELDNFFYARHNKRHSK